MNQSAASPPAGWYADPAEGPSQERYWDGGRWTDDTRAVEPAEPDPPESGSFAEIEVSRQFNLWMGIAVTWDVFVDDSLMGTCKNGKTIRFQIPPGLRTFTVWSQRRKASSNTLQLDVQPGTVRHLHCRMNKGQFYAGLWGSYRRRWAYQAELRRQIREAGGVNRDGILLYEDERFIRPGWAAET